MEDYLKSALEIVKSQAQVRTMTDEEITSMVKRLAAGIKAIDGGKSPEVATEADPAMDPKKAIKENAVVCLECGKAFKVLTKKHLAAHGLTPEQYREKYGYKKGAALCAKGLVRARRKKMQDMRLWERRGKKAEEAPVEQVQ